MRKLFRKNAGRIDRAGRIFEKNAANMCKKGYFSYKKMVIFTEWVYNERKHRKRREERSDGNLCERME